MIHTQLRNMKHITLALCLLLSTHALNAAPFVYVANNMNNAVDVIDAATNTVLTTIPTPTLGDNSAPTCIAIAPNGKTVCVANSNFTSAGSTYQVSVSVIDATLPIPALITTITVTIVPTTLSIPTCIAYTTDSNSIYITCDDQNVYKVTDITGSQTVTTATSAIPNPSCIAIGKTFNGQTAYVGTFANVSGFGIYHMDIATNTPVGIASTGDANTSIQAIAIAPDGNTAYAVAFNSTSSMGFLYAINTTTNTVIGSPTPLAAGSFPTGIVVSPDGNYLYITDNNPPANVIVIPTDNLSDITTFLSGGAFALAITPNSEELYVINMNAVVSPYDVPAGSSAATPILLTGAATKFSIVISPSSLAAPASVSGCKTRNVFLLQTDYINNITWTAPTSGSPVSYNIYRDATLTELAGTVSASGTLQFYDHNRQPNVVYSYYITSVDSSGNQSTAASVTVTNPC